MSRPLSPKMKIHEYNISNNLKNPVSHKMKIRSAERPYSPKQKFDEIIIDSSKLIIQPNIKIPSLDKSIVNNYELYIDLTKNPKYAIGVITNGCDKEFFKYLSENNIKYTSNCIYEYNDEWLTVYKYDDIFKYTNKNLVMLKNIDILKFLEVVNELYTLFPDFGYTPLCSEFYCDIYPSDKSIRISNHEGFDNYHDIFELVFFLKEMNMPIPNILKHFYIRYYEWKDMEILTPITINIKAKLETSDHDGYCSGEENVYNSTIKTYLVTLPPNLVDDINKFTDEDLNKLSYNWESLLPIPNIGGGSHYCENSEESSNNGLDIHDYRYTILSVKLNK